MVLLGWGPNFPVCTGLGSLLGVACYTGSRGHQGTQGVGGRQGAPSPCPLPTPSPQQLAPTLPRPSNHHL